MPYFPCLLNVSDNTVLIELLQIVDEIIHMSACSESTKKQDVL